MISTLLLLAPALALAVPLPKVITTNNIPLSKQLLVKLVESGLCI